MKLTINGQEHQVDVESGMPLLWVLRDVLNMTGTKYGCGVSSCGSCLVLVDGQPVKTCVMPASALVGKSITTIEGLAQDGQLTAVQKAWIEHQVPQCGYCQSGMILAAEALLDSTPEPTDEDIDLAITNICRCGTYQRVKEAIYTASRIREEEKTLLGSISEKLKSSTS